MRMLFTFNLNRTMPDVVMRQFMFDAIDDLFGLCNRHTAIDNNMAGQNVDIAGNRSNMQVVNRFYALRIADNAEQLIGMDVFRRAFHQNVQSLFKQLPAAAPYQSRHQYAGNRIRPLSVIRHHQYGHADIDQQTDDTDHQHAARQNFRRIK